MTLDSKGNPFKVGALYHYFKNIYRIDSINQNDSKLWAHCTLIRRGNNSPMGNSKRPYFILTESFEPYVGDDNKSAAHLLDKEW